MQLEQLAPWPRIAHQTKFTCFSEGQDGGESVNLTCIA